MDADYEAGYHKKLHGSLYKYPEYYGLRARLSHLNYFRGIRDLKRKKILEFGCGLGQNIYGLSKLGVDVSGYDISKFSLDFCKKKGIKTISDMKKAKKFDVIFSRHVLEHVRDPFETLEMLKRHLNKNGLLILILPCERHRRCELKPDVHRHLFSWNFRTINNLLDAAGYKVIENKMLSFAMGYRKLSFLSKISMGIYDFLTKIVGRSRGARELKIVAVKK